MCEAERTSYTIAQGLKEGQEDGRWEMRERHECDENERR